MADEDEGVSSFYDAYGVELGLSEDYEHLAPVLPDLSGLRILDAGCGLGDGSRYLAEQGASVTGIDTSRSEITIARERHGEVVDFQQMDLRNPLAFEDEAFDLIVCALTLGHLQDWDQPFSEFARLLTPDGHVVIHAHHPVVDYLELETGSNQVFDADPTYTDIEPFDRPWGPDNQPLRFYRRPLGELFQPALTAGLLLETFIEPGTGSHQTDRYDPETPPRHLLLRYQKPPTKSDQQC